MTIRALFDHCEANGYAFAVRLEPDRQGFTMSIMAGRYDGAYPCWEKRFPAGTSYTVAADLLAKSPLFYFNATTTASGQPPVTGWKR